MNVIKTFIFCIIFIFLFNNNLYPLILCSFQSIKKISDNGDYFVILDKGIYIYNFENYKCERITGLNEAIFKSNDTYNQIIISKNYNISSNETKIAALINQYLYIYTYDNSKKIFTYIILESLIDSGNTIFPFYVEIDNRKLAINLIEYQLNTLTPRYYISLFEFENYLSIKNDEPQIIKYDEDFANKLKCQLDIDNSIIKCIYNILYNLKYIEIQKSNKSFSLITQIIIENSWSFYFNYESIEFTFSKNIVFVCFCESDSIKCCFKKDSEGEFTVISYDFENKCSEFKTYYFEEKNQFILSCKKSTVYNLYLFNENDMNNNIKVKTFTLENYNGKYSIIYNSKTDDYDIIYDGNFTETCEEFNKEEQFPFITTTQIEEIINTTNVNIYSTIKTDESTNLYNYLLDTITTNESNNLYNYQSDIVLETKISSSLSNSYFYSYINYSKFLYELYKNFKDNIIGGNVNITAMKEGKHYTYKEKGLLMSFTTTNSQKEKENKNETKINLGQCEDKLKEFYNISKDNSLYILKLEIEQKFLNIPKIEYDIYYPLNNSKMEQLNLSACENTKIEISIPVNINNDDIEKYNPISNYYTDICSRTTSDNGTDMTSKDRREEFFNKNMSLCEDNCIFKEYDYDNGEAICECGVKTFLSFIDEIKIDKNNLMKNFREVKNFANIKIIKCYKMVFEKENLINNYGFFILISILLILIICQILFFLRYYQLLIKEINAIIRAKKNLFPNETIQYKKKNIKKVNKTLKNNNSKRLNQSTNLIQNLKLNKKRRARKKVSFPPKKNKTKNINNKSLTKINSSKKKTTTDEIISKKPQNKDKKILEFNDYELNSLSYKDALKYDQRTFLNYYCSLFRKNHLIAFSFFPNTDYNSQIIKIFLFFFFFASNLIVPALFFNDATMHKIYLDSGKFNLNYQIPHCVYSSLISGVINIIIKFFALTEKQVILIKQMKPVNNLDEKIKIIKHELKRKFIIFFIVSFIFLSLFCLYISCFCCIYVNTQILLIEDSLIGFGLSLIYPFFIYLIPGMFRLPALKAPKSNKEYLYKFSKMIQMI